MGNSNRRRASEIIISLSPSFYHRPCCSQRTGSLNANPSLKPAGGLDLSHFEQTRVSVNPSSRQPVAAGAASMCTAASSSRTTASCACTPDVTRERGSWDHREPTSVRQISTLRHKWLQYAGRHASSPEAQPRPAFFTLPLPQTLNSVPSLSPPALAAAGEDAWRNVPQEGP